MKLYAPLSYWNAKENEKKSICNGCGAKKGLNVPDTFYGLSITQACNIHDWMYKEGTTQADKLFADAIFRLNLSIIIDTNSNFLTAILRHSRASTYYTVVARWGDDAFWIDKNRNDEMVITYKGEFR
ncbi:MAG: hypothetical protein RBT59_08775 [Arcobacteraceae bacterium]|jgi:hypothetical protein|nr:hypothetical protein [Arcobacteraceae bacterium]